MKHVVSFSGGLTSAYLVHLKPDADYILMDTGAEHEKTYEFIKRVVKEWDINLYRRGRQTFGTGGMSWSVQAYLPSEAGLELELASTR